MFCAVTEFVPFFLDSGSAKWIFWGPVFLPSRPPAPLPSPSSLCRADLSVTVRRSAFFCPHHNRSSSFLFLLFKISTFISCFFSILALPLLSPGFRFQVHRLLCESLSSCVLIYKVGKHHHLYLWVVQRMR